MRLGMTGDNPPLILYVFTLYTWKMCPLFNNSLLITPPNNCGALTAELLANFPFKSKTFRKGVGKVIINGLKGKE
jgi:hypothetical protein